MTAIGTLTQNTELHEKSASRRPPVSGPIATPSPENPDHTAIARPLLGVAEHVGEDRQGGRHDQGPAHAHERPAQGELHRGRREGGRHRSGGEHDEADLQAAPLRP